MRIIHVWSVQLLDDRLANEAPLFMDLLKLFRSEHKVGVGDAQGFQQEICKLEPSKRLEMIQGMAGAGKDSAALDKDGNIRFDGQFTIGSSGGTSSDNKFNLGSSGAADKTSIIDSHNNRVNVYCGENADSRTAAGIDPKTFEQLNKGAGDDPAPVAEGVMESKSDIELANHTHIIIDQIGDKPAKVTLPEGVSAKTLKDGAIEIQLNGGTLRFANGGISSTGDVGDIKSSTTNNVISDQP